MALFLVMLCSPALSGEETAPRLATDFVAIQQIDPTIVLDLRYAGSNNITGQPLYSRDMPALVRFGVAQRLVCAQKYLKAHGYCLKIWDAYRPKSAQQKLWEAMRNSDYVADPREGLGSMHTRGTAVDATLVDQSGREVVMPTGFDSFTPAAMLAYQGGDPLVRSNLLLLQKAMARAGFYGLRTEWWHFCAADWREYPSTPEFHLEVQATDSPSITLLDSSTPR